MEIAIAETRDWERIIEIYNEAVLDGYSTADLDTVSVEVRRDWLQIHGPDDYPIYIENEAGIIRGWCSISPYRAGRMAVRHTAEISYYVAREHRRKGVATRLIDHALGDASRLGIKVLFGILLDSNETSVALLEKRFGFERWGYLPRVAKIDGREFGHVYLGKRVG